MTARTGDVIATVEDLEALPTGAVLARIHEDQSGPSIYVNDQDLGWVMATEQCNSPGLGSHDQAGNRRTPLTVLHVPGEQVREDATQRLALAAFLVDFTHHFHVPEGSDRPVCSCGFVGSARRRAQTEHITSAVLEAFDHD